MPNIDPRTWTQRSLVHALLMLGIVIGAIGHDLALFRWYIEDAAIDFGYANNIADGYGAVAQPGLERVEGYSNPTWLAILVALRWLGADLFVAVHWVELVICIVTVVAAYFAAREVAGKDNELPLLVPAFLAANSQFAIWAQAGLENGLWNLIFVFGVWRTARELRDEEPGHRYPWSALAWLLLALTRPEGILYAAVAGFCHLAWHLVERRTLVPSLWWLVTFFAPWGVYQYVHYQYFAWPFPNTYYAKMSLKEQAPFDWNKRGWNWTRSFFLEMGQAFFLPVWLFGLIGHGGWRTLLVGGSFVVLALSLELSDNQRQLLLAVITSLWFLFWLGLRVTEERAPRLVLGVGTLVALALWGLSEALRYAGHAPNTLPVPEVLKLAPPYLLLAVAGVLPLFSLGTERWAMRWLFWWTCWAAVFFSVWSLGDWMKGYRWFAMCTVPGAFLFAYGADAFARHVDDMFEVTRRGERSWSPVAVGVVVALVLLQLPANVYQTYKVGTDPDPSPKGIKPRIEYVERTMARLHYDEPIVSVDVDMGAHLLWTDWRMLDVAGLVDLPFAHNKFEKPFVREYLFVEQRPPYIHIHGSWASNSKIPTHPEFKSDYYEVPGFAAGKDQFHIGNYVRRDLLVRPGARDEATGVVLEHGLVLYPPEVPAEPGVARKFEVSIGVRNTEGGVRKKKKDDDDFRLMLFAARDGVVAKVWDLPPGWDWLFPHDWKPDEQFVGPFTLSLGPLEAGTYDLGYLVTAEDGRVIAPKPGQPLPAGVRIGGGDVPPVYAAGELVYPGALVVLPVEERAARASAERDQAVADAEHDQCESAEGHWRLARQHRAGERNWQAETQDRVALALAECWARTSDGRDRPEQVRRMLRAKRWNFEAPAYVVRAVALATELEGEGAEARARQDWEAAYRAFADAVELDGTRAWARRYAEEARGFRLGIDPESLAAKEAEEAARRTKPKKQRKSAIIGRNGEFDAPLPAEPALPEEPEGPAEPVGGDQ